MVKPRYNQKINLTIRNLGINGEGVGLWHGYRVFVDGALPGEVITARVKERNRSYGKARVETILNPSMDRRVPRCPHFSQCGGCQLQHLAYDKQLEYKKNQVENAFKKFCEPLEVEACEGVPYTFGYRNKAVYPVIKFEGKSLFGLYARESHEIVALDRCLLHLPIIEEVFFKIRPFLEEIEPFDPKSGNGLLRYVALRANRNNEVLLTLVLKQEEDVSFLVEKMVSAAHEIKGIVININPKEGNQLFSQNFKLLFGSSCVYEKLNGLKFKISAGSFFQVNPWQAEKIYDTALNLAEIKKDDIVLDAFCGTGTIALLASLKAKKVVGVESCFDAILDAKWNALENKRENVSFFNDKAEEFIKNEEKIDLLFLNPPRKGIEPSFLANLSSINLNRIIYISCNPASLARDSKELLKIGFKIEKVKPFDLFPNTYHVETVVKFSKV